MKTATARQRVGQRYGDRKQRRLEEHHNRARQFGQRKRNTEKDTV